ncbi:MAG: DMT family transporter [Chloroflexi bacterium]|nr:DMT family transporter [Chloroflexota bacterium]
MTQHKIYPWIAATAAVFIWGASFIATKFALRDIQPVTIVWLRFAMGLGVLGAVVAARRQFALPRRDEWGYLTLLGFLGITFHQWLQSNGLVTSQASTTAWIVATMPVFMALLGWLALKEKLRGLQWLGILLAAVGVLLLVTRGDLKSVLAGSFGAAGDVLILISAPNWAIFSVLSRKGLQHHPPARMMFYVMLLGWLLTTIHFFAVAGVSDIPNLTANGWIGVVFLGVVCSGLAYVFWYDALQALPAAQLGVFLYVEPLVAAALAAWMLGEPLLPVTLLGGAAILFGVWLVNR